MDFWTSLKDVGIWFGGMGIAVAVAVAIYILFFAQGLPSWLS